MTRKNYNKIASLIHNAVTDDIGNTREGIILLSDVIADYFKEDNCLFDKDRFMKACGLKE